MTQEQLTLSKHPIFYCMGDEIWNAADGTPYVGLLGNFMVFEEGEGKPEGQPYPMMLFDVSLAKGHLKECLDNGFELICLNLRPGWHHVKKV